MRLDDLTADKKTCVYGLIIAGTRLLDPEQYDVDYYLNKAGNHAVILTEKASGKTKMVSLKGVLKTLDRLAEMENLQELVIAVEPLNDISAGQRLAGLRKLTVISCEKLTTLKPLFSLPELEEITISHCRIKSLTGIDRLQKLKTLEVSGTQVKDLEPLTLVNYAWSEKQGGFIFRCFDHLIPDFSPLKSVPSFKELGIEDTDGLNWTNAVKNARISSLHVKDWQKQLSFAATMMNHPELESLTLENCTKLTKLAVLEDMPNLKDVYVTEDMESLIRPLKTENCRFTLHILAVPVVREAYLEGDPNLREVVYENSEDNYY